MKRRILSAVIVLIGMLMIGILMSSFSHNYSDNPADSDLIVLLGGGDEGRMEKAAELYKEGYAEQVLITPVRKSDEAKQSVELANEYGIPTEDLITEENASSTHTNATITMDIMESDDMDSALIVTSDYHIKRSKYAFEEENNSDFDFNYIAALSDEGERWYETEHATYFWITEFTKNAGYRAGLYEWIDT